MNIQDILTSDKILLKARVLRTYISKNKTDPEVLHAQEQIKISGGESENTKLIAKFILGTAKVCPICGKIHCTRIDTCSHECSVKYNKQKCLKKYGVENISQLKDTKEKVKKTNLAKFGSGCSLHSPEMEKRVKETFFQKYGVDCPLKSKEIINKRAKTVQERYGVSNVFQNENIKDKIKETCLEKYGVENFSKSKTFKAIFLSKLLDDLKNTSAKNLNLLTLEKLKEFEIFENNTHYFDNIKCEKFYNVDYSYILRIKTCFDIKLPNITSWAGRSYEEIELFDWIPCENKISNDRLILNPYELDMLLPDYKLAIEYNGVYWHSDEYKEQNYHLNKTLECNNKGIQLFHIFDTDDIDIWKSMISNKLHLNTKIYARKCTVKEITNSIAKSFCTQNHLQGACNAKINLGLFYNDELLEVMTFGKPRYNKHYEFELLRLCTKKYYSVIGGASKLWKCFCQKYSPKSVISYANRRFSNGNIYETLGFKFLNETKPNYWYVKNGELFSRLKFQKHKLKKMFENSELKVYNDTMSESEIMLMNNYYKIYDCGNLVYGFNIFNK